MKIYFFINKSRNTYNVHGKIQHASYSMIFLSVSKRQTCDCKKKQTNSKGLPPEQSEGLYLDATMVAFTILCSTVRTSGTDSDDLGQLPYKPTSTTRIMPRTSNTDGVLTRTGN